MGKVVVSEFITVDGVVEDPGGAEAFDHGGWAFKFDRGPEGDQFKFDEVMASGALLLGRKTYEGFAQAWPSRTDEFADRFNTMPKYVVSSTLRDPTWTNSHVISGDVPAAIRRLHDDTDGDVLVNGSVQLAQSLTEHGLVDEYRLMVFPTVLGAGRRLFGEHTEPTMLTLVDNQPAGQTLILTYRPAAAAPPG